MSNYTYNGKFSKNIPILGQTGCDKTKFAQNLTRNNIFGKLKKVNWISKIELSKKQKSTSYRVFKKSGLNFTILVMLLNLKLSFKIFNEKKKIMTMTIIMANTMQIF